MRGICSPIEIKKTLKLQPTGHVHWNNEADPLTIWMDLPTGWRAVAPIFRVPQPQEPESRETRVLDFEVQSSETATSGTVKAYALYSICDDKGGQCLYRRQDIGIPIRFREYSV